MQPETLEQLSIQCNKFNNVLVEKQFHTVITKKCKKHQSRPNRTMLFVKHKNKTLAVQCNNKKSWFTLKVNKLPKNYLSNNINLTDATVFIKNCWA